MGWYNVERLKRTSERVYFENSKGIKLCGIIDRPEIEPTATALFSHCFTCTKDLKAIVKISRFLAESGIAVLRFDFTGLGDSQGDFSGSNFDSNCEDLLSAVDCMASRFHPPKLMIGHSLGGAAMIAMSSRIASVKGLVTIASPSSTKHLADFLSQTNPAILSQGEGVVEIGGRQYLLKRQLIDNLRQQDLEQRLKELSIPHLIFHPPEDETLPYWHAETMFELTGGAKSMVTLDGSDHLLVKRPDDCHFVSQMIANWFHRIADDR
ncbi:MAG: alpha/beta fold hydrolase [Planctomycetota bacterium]